MRNGTSFTPPLESQAGAISPGLPENQADMHWASDEILGTPFSAGDPANDRLLEINSQLRLDRIARSRRDEVRLRKISPPRLICADGVIVSARNESGDPAYLAALVALRSWIGRYLIHHKRS